MAFEVKAVLTEFGSSIVTQLSSRRGSRSSVPAQKDADEEIENPDPSEIRVNLYNSVDEEPEAVVKDEFSFLFTNDVEAKSNLLGQVGTHDSVADIESLLLAHIPLCIAPEVFDTFLVIHKISPKNQ
ncbi:hypothetical protein P9112_005219 [Eukaryota sp. TZLM1-RC]